MSTAGDLHHEFPDENFSILAFCDACAHQAPLDRALIPAGVTVQQLRGRLRCSTCGSREASIRIVYTGAGGFRYGGRGAPPKPG